MLRMLLFALLLPVALSAASLEDRMDEARTSFRRGNEARALELAGLIIKDHPDLADVWFFHGQIQVARRQYAEALADFDRTLQLDRLHLFAWQERGAVHFRQGRFEQAIKDWDELIRLEPGREPYHWQRGIGYYYAGRYEDGRKQFVSHQRVNPSDVENAVFHFICNARAHGLAQARKELIPIQGDSRAPMAELHKLYGGQLDAAAVMAAARKQSSPTRQAPEFYAHYYLGLYFEVTGDAAKTREHIFAAEKLADTAGYMGDCARVHASLLRAKAN